MANEVAPGLANTPEQLGVSSGGPVVGLAPVTEAPAKPPETKAEPKAEAAKAEAKRPANVKAAPKKLPLEAGQPVIYWDLAQKATGVRMTHGHKTDLTPRFGIIAEVHPAGVIHLAFLVPGAWIHISCEESDKPQIGKFTRLD